jgi:hypothetical protein
MRARLVKENINDLFVPKSKEEIIKQLNNLTQEEKNEKLLDATWNNQYYLVKLLIEFGADINAKDVIGSTPLMLATSSSNLEIVKLLLEVGVDINAKSKAGNNALMIASAYKHKDIVTLLKKYGAK